MLKLRLILGFKGIANLRVCNVLLDATWHSKGRIDSHVISRV